MQPVPIWKLDRFADIICYFIIGLLLQGCFDNGSDGSDAPSPPPATTIPPIIVPVEPPVLDEIDLNSASRLAARATFGLSYEKIAQIAQWGEENWLNIQFLIPPGLHKPVVDQLKQRQLSGEFGAIEKEIDNFEFFFRRMALWQQLMNSPDTLRQRVAFALSEIFVVSENVDALFADPYALSDYYDTLLVHAFGNYRDLLKAVTLHPSMGVYLSHVNNRKANPDKNTFPDENYAREVMQLFSIGLFELNRNGTLKRDDQGNPIPTYGNKEIREFAKIFTGLSFGGPGAHFGNPRPYFLAPMQMFDSQHTPGQKRLLNGVVVPAGQTGMQDVENALDNLFNHPNVGPFIGKLLIQRLVTSNPSSDYVERVAQAFNGESSGVRGDMKAVLRAVLLDPEAEEYDRAAIDFGKLREPLLRYTALLRQFNASSADGFFANLGIFVQELARQHPLSAPSVFNFYLPTYSPSGEIANLGLVAPEFQITNASTIVGISNLADIVLFVGLVNDFQEPPFMSAQLDLSEYLLIAEDSGKLLDRLDTTMTYGELSEEMRSVILEIIEPIEQSELRIKMAIYLIFTSPDYAVRT